MDSTMHYTIIYFFAWLSMLSLGLALFRFDWRSYRKPLLISVFPLTLISVLLQEFDKAYLTAIVQPGCAVLCFWLMFGFRLRNSFLMVAHFYCFNLFLELVLNLVFSSFDLKQVLLMLQGNDLFVVGLLLSVVNFTVCLIFRKMRWGFSFVSSSRKFVIRTLSISREILTVLLTCLFFLGLTSLCIFFMEQLTFWVQFLLFLMWLLLLKLVYQREQMD